jgi:NAD(P)H-flavin reductase
VGVDPIAGSSDPTLMRAYQQAQLEQQLVERQLAGSRRQKAGARAYADEQRSADDGFRPGDQSHLRTVQDKLLEYLALIGSPDELSRRLAKQLDAGTPLYDAALANPADLGEAITWLAHNMGRPHLVSHACGQFGPALAVLLGNAPNQLNAFAAAMFDALHASAGQQWTAEFDQAWHATWDVVVRYLRTGMESVRYDPPYWMGAVIGHDRRRNDIAVMRVRTYLPYPFRPGQYAVIESALRPDAWRAVWIASLPQPDNTMELHVQAAPGDAVAEALVHRTAAGDRIRLRPAAGNLQLTPRSDRALLLVAGGAGVAPMKALLTQLRENHDERLAHLFWGVRRREDLYDIEALRGLGATVMAAVAEGPAYPYSSGRVHEVAADFGDWHTNDVFVAGSPPMVRATVDLLVERGVPAEHIHSGATGDN